MKETYSNWKRWCLYQQERFPIASYGILVAAFSMSSVAYVASSLGIKTLPFLSGSVAFILCFLFFLQLRIADEFKDFEEDRRWRPERPVPRGLVSLQELLAIGICAGVVQLVASVTLEPRILLVLLLAWAYLLLMTAEFFVPSWLTAHHLAYMLSHLVIMPLIAMLAGACVWISYGKSMPDISSFLAFCYGSGAILELGRKIKSPTEERVGVKTYSSIWGGRTAAFAWLLALISSVTFGVLSIRGETLRYLGIGLLGSLLLIAFYLATSYARNLTLQSAKRLEIFSAVWILISHLVVGVIPYCMFALTTP